MKVTYSASSDIGRQRQVNQDSYGVSDNVKSEQLGQLIVVCDGMGGHAAGEVASQIGVEEILNSFYGAGPGTPESLLIDAFERANKRIHAEGRGGMGTTGVAVLLYGDAAVLANVGDSRAYLVRGEGIRQLTRDHSYVQEQIDARLLTVEEARVSQYRNMITRALGYRQTVSVDTFREAVQAGDVLILSTDGMHGVLEEGEIRQIVSEYRPSVAVRRMIEVANERGGPDNITVVVVRIDAVGAEHGVLVTVDEAVPSGIGLHDAPTQPLPVVDEAAHERGGQQASALRSRLNRLLGLMLVVLLVGAGMGSVLLFGGGGRGVVRGSVPPLVTGTLAPTDTMTTTPVPRMTPITPPALRATP